jgi:hypothetical protein
MWRWSTPESDRSIVDDPQARSWCWSWARTPSGSLQGWQRIAGLWSTKAGLVDQMPLDACRGGRAAHAARMCGGEHADLCERIDTGRALDDDAWEMLTQTARAAIAHLPQAH